MNDAVETKSSKKFKLKWLEKIKNVKHIEIIVVVIFLIVILLIYFSNFKTKSQKTTEKVESLTISRYVDDLEKNLAETLSHIKGVSDVNVMITLDLKNAIIEDNVIQTNNFPEIKGIVVVAKGVEVTSVKLNVLKAIEAVVTINSGCVEILSSN